MVAEGPECGVGGRAVGRRTEGGEGRLLLLLAMVLKLGASITGLKQKRDCSLERADADEDEDDRRRGDGGCES